MRAVIKLLSILMVATVCAGFAYAHYQASNRYDSYTFHEVLKAGETIEEIASKYYNAYSEPRNWEEFKYDNITIRNRVLLHREDGSPRVPRIGDIVCIEVRVKQ